MRCIILLPEESQGDVFSPQLGVDLRPAGKLATGPPSLELEEEPLFEGLVVEVLR